jgi:phosphoadenosine phosphosulfate reductase
MLDMTPDMTRERVPSPRSDAAIQEEAALLSACVLGLDGEALLAALLGTGLKDRIALVSSFGAESGVLLHMAASIDRSIPVIFVDTGKLFGETLRYRDTLIATLGLRDVRSVRPSQAAEQARDPKGLLWSEDANACCHFRKVEPLRRALDGFDAWVSGRKRYQGGERQALPVIEIADGKIKVNLLASWTRDRIQTEFAARGLPRHPLEADGYLSIGCMPCTDRVAPDEDVRAGRWRGMVKTECGIHQRWAQAPNLSTSS